MMMVTKFFFVSASEWTHHHHDSLKLKDESYCMKVYKLVRMGSSVIIYFLILSPGGIQERTWNLHTHIHGENMGMRI